MNISFLISESDWRSLLYCPLGSLYATLTLGRLPPFLVFQLKPVVSSELFVQYYFKEGMCSPSPFDSSLHSSNISFLLFSNSTCDQDLVPNLTLRKTSHFITLYHRLVRIFCSAIFPQSEHYFASTPYCHESRVIMW